MHIPQGDIDLLAIGETLIDFISVETTDSLRHAATFQRFPGGSPANIAMYVAKLGGAAAIVSKVGVDAFGQFIADELRGHGVNTEYLVADPQTHTTVIFVSRTTGTPDFSAMRGGDALLRPDDLNDAAIARAKIVHASTFALSREPCRSAVRKAFGLARQRGALVSLDPNYSPRIWPDFTEARAVIRELYGYANLTKPSRDDAERLFGPGHSPEEYIAMFHDMGPQVVIFTMGKEGALISDNGRVIAHIPARPVNVVDATGAGDSFWAGFLVALLDGRPLEQCALFAREIVELKLTTVGPLPGAINRREVYERLGV